METPARAFILSLGGYQAVASALGKRPTTVHSAMQAGTFPAAWYCALCELASQHGVGAPERSLFSFIHLAQPKVAA